MNLSELKAKKLVEDIKDEGVVIEYLGIKKVPYADIKQTYKVFPEELKDKEVYVFQALCSNKTSVICQYYVDSNSDIYKDSYPQNTECMKI